MEVKKEYVIELTNNLLSYIKPIQAFNNESNFVFVFQREANGHKYDYHCRIEKSELKINVNIYFDGWSQYLHCEKLDQIDHSKLLVKCCEVYEEFEVKFLQDIFVIPDGKDAFDALVK